MEEEPFTELTQTYYNLEIKSIKFKKDSLNKITHQVGFKSEKLKYQSFIFCFFALVFVRETRFQSGVFLRDEANTSTGQR